MTAKVVDLYARQVTGLVLKAGNALANAEYPWTPEGAAAVISVGVSCMRDLGVSKDDVKELIDMLYAPKAPTDG